MLLVLLWNTRQSLLSARSRCVRAVRVVWTKKALNSGLSVLLMSESSATLAPPRTKLTLPLVTVGSPLIIPSKFWPTPSLRLVLLTL